MTFETLDDVFAYELDDLYSAEKQILKALPKMADAAMLEELAGAFMDHLKQSEDHVLRLERVAKELDLSIGKAECKGMQGLIKEGGTLTKEDSSTVLDAVMISAAQKVEHYEISGYGSLITFAKQLEYSDEIVDLLVETLEEEKEADAILSDIAENEVNPESA